MPSSYKVYRIRRTGKQVLVSEHLHLDDAKVKASHLRGQVVVTDPRGVAVPYDES